MDAIILFVILRGQWYAGKFNDKIIMLSRTGSLQDASRSGLSDRTNRLLYSVWSSGCGYSKVGLFSKNTRKSSRS